MVVTLDDGRQLVGFARNVLETHFGETKLALSESVKHFLSEKRGCFVTLKQFPSKNLRGCIGYVEPIFSLGVALEKSALSAALDDPRFPPVQENELDGLLVEISVLTPPSLIEVDTNSDYLEKIVVGRDGLIVEHGFYKGLLLPQVPGEYGWSVEEFLGHTCMKAGLPQDQWQKEVKIYSFQAQVFSEVEPKGEVVEEL